MEATANAHSHLKRAKALPSLPIICLARRASPERSLAVCIVALWDCVMTIAGCAFFRRSANWMSSSMIRQLFATRGGSVPGRYTEHSASDSIIM